MNAINEKLLQKPFENSLDSDRRNKKTSILSTNVDHKFLETEFLIAICHRSGNKWQLKTLFLAIFDRHSSIVKRVFDCRLSGMFYTYHTGLQGSRLVKIPWQIVPFKS